MKQFFIISSLLLLLVGCSTTPPTKDTIIYNIEPFPNETKNFNKSRVVVENNNNLTRIYTIKGEK